MADDGTKVSSLPLSENLDDDDLFMVVEDDISKKAEVGYIKQLIVGSVDSAPTQGSTNLVQSGGVYTALAAKANTSDLATVATSGSYDDLSDKPTIPDELADLTDDATHRLVTDEEKEAWDSKAEVEANPSGTATEDLETLKVDNVVYALAGEKVYGEASGAVASFSDGADDKPVKSLTIGIEPVQDLHGYDGSWPAGGGKNKVKTLNGEYATGLGTNVYANGYQGYTITGKEGGFTANSSSSNSVLLFLGELKAGTYTISFTKTQSGINSRIRKSTTKEFPFTTTNVTLNTADSSITFTSDGSGYYWLNCYASNLNYDFSNVQLEEGSTATDYAPYANECPISGWAGAEVYRTGKNIFDKTNTVSGIWQADGTFDSNSLYTTIYCYVTPNTTYSIQGIDSWDNWRLCYFNTLNPTTFTKRNTNKGNSFTTDSDTIMISFSVPTTGYKGGEGVQIEIGTTATDYEPYKGNTYNLTWQSTAGTVYGGQLTVFEDGSGDMSVTHKEVDLGNATWTYSSPHFEISFSDNAVGYNGDNLCSVYPKSSVNNISTGQPDKTFVTRETFFCIRDNDYVNEQWQGDVQGFKASMAGQTLVYELATPQTYTFPSGTFPIIKTLLGENNIWNDINDTDVVYQRDLNIVINDILRRLEALENA